MVNQTKGDEMKVHTIFTTIIIGASLMSANASAESLCSSERPNKDEKHTVAQGEKEKKSKENSHYQQA